MTRNCLPRPLVVALAGLLVFCMILVLPQTAAHADTQIKYGEPDSFSEDGGFGFRDFKITPVCNGSAWWVARHDDQTGLIAFYVHYKAACTQPGTGIFNNPSRDVRVDGTTTGGESCDDRGPFNFPTTDKNLSTWKEEGEMLMGYEVNPGWTGLPPLIPGLGGLCTPTRIDSTKHGAQGSVWSAEIELGPKPTFTAAEEGVCPYGKPISASSRLDVGATNGVLRDKVDPIVNFNGAGATGRWRGYMFYTITGSSTVLVKEFGSSVDLTGQTTFEYPNTVNTNPTTNTNGVTNIIGVQVGVISPTISQNAVTSLAAGVNATTLTGNYGHGVTVPTACRFWFGEKVYNDAANEYDEPWGNLTEPHPEPEAIGSDVEPTEDPVTPEPDVPGEPEEACNFDLLDPGSWLEGGMCAVVGLLGKIVTVLVAMLDAVVGIVGEIGELFIAMFVPDPTTWGLEGMQTQFQERPPGSLISGAASGVSGMGSGMDAGGCGTLIDVSPSTGSGGQITCSAVKNVPGYSAGYSIFTLCIYALTGLAVFRMFTGALNSGHD